MTRLNDDRPDAQDNQSDASVFRIARFFFLKKKKRQWGGIFPEFNHIASTHYTFLTIHQFVSDI